MGGKVKCSTGESFFPSYKKCIFYSFHVHLGLQFHEELIMGLLGFSRLKCSFLLHFETSPRVHVHYSCDMFILSRASGQQS